MDTVVGAFGGLDILVNNAGVALPTNTQQDEDDFLDELGPHRRRQPDGPRPPRAPRRAALPAPPAPGGSSTSRRPSRSSRRAGMVGYTATKAGVVGLTKSFAVELGRQGITVNCICPGPIRTGMTAPISDEDKNDLRPPPRPAAPLRRSRGGRPDDAQHVPAGGQLPQRRHRPRRRRDVDPPHVTVTPGAAGPTAPGLSAPRRSVGATHRSAAST